MKNLTLIFIVSTLALASCQQCYECEQTVNGVKETESFCGDPAQADEYEAAGYTCYAN
jgi:hypothetical protein